MEVQYDTTMGKLPRAAAGYRLHSIRFSTCPNASLSVKVVRENSSPLEAQGTAADSWWVIETPRLPTRCVRMFEGSHSMAQFLLKFGLLDATGCVHHKRAILAYAPADEALPPYPLDRHVPTTLQDARGVPQFYPRSGVCWFASLCGVFFARSDVLAWLENFMPPSMHALAERSLYHREDAQKLRNLWWTEYSVGDDISLPPEMDGRNGFSEFTTMCAKLGIPLVRLDMREEGNVLMPNEVRDRRKVPCTVHLPDKGEKHLLALRYIDGDHHARHPLQRRIVVNGVRYRLLGVTSGHRKCGHQIGWVALDGWRHLMAVDADLHKDGIGPLFVHFDGSEWQERWWEGCREMLHVHKFGSGHREFCNLSPHNERDDMLDKYRAVSNRRSPGTLSVDALYMSC